MENRRLHGQTGVGISCIVVCSLMGAWLLATGISYFFSFICLAIVVSVGYWLTRVMNEANRQLSLFFDAMRGKDFGRRYPADTGDTFLDNLYAEMNRIVSLFAAGNREQEEKRIYYESILRVLTHEIRNSLTPVTSLSANLLTHADESSPAEIKEGLEVIHSQAKNLSSFLDAYHRLTHLPDPEKKATEVAAVFRKLGRLLGAEPGHACIQYHMAERVSLQADPNLLTLALINLIRNAMQAVAGQPGGWVKVEASLPGSRPAITVTDNGPGIPPERLPDIFTPFFSTKTGGSGIGLSLSRRIMRLHGGELTVASEPGKQTVFRMRF